MKEGLMVIGLLLRISTTQGGIDVATDSSEEI